MNSSSLDAGLDLDREFLATELRGRGLEPEWLRVTDRTRVREQGA